MMLASTADMIVVHEFVAPAEQLPLSRRHFVPPALTTSGNLGEGARFAMQRWGDGGGRCIDLT
jgi:hypothetical protein